MDNPTNPIVGEVLTALRRLIRAVDLQSKRISRDYGATIPQMIVLQEIQKIGIASAAEIAMAVSLSQATVTSILTRLEGRGLILRLRSNQDRRKVELSVTEKGLRLLTSSPKLLHDKFISEFAKLERWEQLQILSSIQSSGRPRFESQRPTHSPSNHQVGSLSMRSIPLLSTTGFYPSTPRYSRW